MNQKIRYLFTFIFVIMLLCNCDKQVSYLPVIYVPADIDSMIKIKKWLVIGPFEIDTVSSSAATSFLNEDLKRYGIEEEGWIDDAGIKKLFEQGAGMFLIEETTHKIRLFNYISDNIENKSNLYLAARINSANDQEMALITDGSSSYAGWLNGEKLIEDTNKFNTSKIGDRFINISLKKGNNMLFFKVNRGTNLLSWDLCCTVASLRDSKRIFRTNYMKDFVVNPLINDSVKIYAGPYLSGKVEVVDEDDNIVVGSSYHNQDTFSNFFTLSGLNVLTEGFYKTILTVDGIRMEQMIYKGDYDEFVEQANAVVARIDGSSSYGEDLKATVQLVNYRKNTSQNSSSPNDKRYWERNRVFWGYSFHTMINKNATTQLMTYKDEDGVPGIFVFHHGNSGQQNIPLIIVVPFNINGDSLLEDWYLSDLDHIETESALSDQYGFALAFIYAWGKNYTAEKTEKEISAVLNRLMLEYDIDNNHIFIFGECEGGRRALVQLSRTPDRYAACAVTSPITLSGIAGEIPINLIPRMGTTPIMIKHGFNDENISVENSRRFFAESLKYDIPVEYVETDDSHTSINKDHRRYAYEFFSKIVQKR